MPPVVVLRLGISVKVPFQSYWPCELAGCRVEKFTCWYSNPALKLCLPRIFVKSSVTGGSG